MDKLENNCMSSAKEVRVGKIAIFMRTLLRLSQQMTNERLIPLRKPRYNMLKWYFNANAAFSDHQQTNAVSFPRKGAPRFL